MSNWIQGTREEETWDRPELQVNYTLHTNLRHVVVVEERVCDAGDHKEEDTRCHKQESAQICLSGGFGSGGVNGD